MFAAARTPGADAPGSPKAAKDVEARKATNQSIMPAGLFDKLAPPEVRDLVAYLAGREQVPLPKKE